MEKEKFKMLHDFLFEGEYSKLSNDARVLYAFMLDRAKLSALNASDFTDNNGKIYIIYTVEQIIADIQCARQKAIQISNQLEAVGLIEKRRQGQGKPSLIYVKDFSEVRKSYFLKYENHTSKDMKIIPLEVWKSNGSNTDPSQTNNNQTDTNQTLKGKVYTKSLSSQTEISKTDNSLTNDADIDFSENKNPVVSSEIPNKPPKDSGTTNPLPVYDYQTYKDIIHKNISYSHFKQHIFHFDIKFIDELVENMLDVITTQRQKIRINSELKDRQLVINRYLSLNATDIEHIMYKFKEQRGKITHIAAYLRTLLYTVKQELNSYYTNAVSVDGMVPM